MLTCERCGALLGRGSLVAAYLEAPAGAVLCCVDCPGCLCAAPHVLTPEETARRLRERLEMGLR